jgi:hypothetical protein
MRAAIALFGVLTSGLVVYAQTATTVHVCVSTDQVMRVQSAPTCPGGQASYRLVLASGQGGGGGPAPTAGDDKGASAQVADLKKTIDFLRDRVLNLEKEFADVEQVKGGSKVMAPFEVVDKSGKMILRVTGDPHGLVMANPAGQNVLWASALEKGGLFKTRSASSFPEVVMGSNGAVGAFVVRDAEDQGRISISLTGGKPYFNLLNDNHTGVVSIEQAETGGGRIRLGAASGESVVQAGVTSGGKCGRVDTYPATNPGRQMVGAAASFIVGGC